MSSKTQYTYAVARIRALEVSLFSASTLEQLLACKDMDGCLRFLQERGSGRCMWICHCSMCFYIPAGSII